MTVNKFKVTLCYYPNHDQERVGDKCGYVVLTSRVPSPRKPTFCPLDTKFPIVRDLSGCRIDTSQPIEWEGLALGKYTSGQRQVYDDLLAVLRELSASTKLKPKKGTLVKKVIEIEGDDVVRRPLSTVKKRGLRVGRIPGMSWKTSPKIKD